MVKKSCDKCPAEVEFKVLKKIRGEYHCKDCAKARRLVRREETIEKAGIKDELKELDENIKEQYKETKRKDAKKRYQKNKPAFKKKKIVSGVPVPKGSISGKAKLRHVSESYLGFQESQVLLSILVKRGMDFEDAKDEIKRIKDLASNFELS